nr:MAG TPA: hypothetical protein [Caudoviricetes sp.]
MHRLLYIIKSTMKTFIIVMLSSFIGLLVSGQYKKFFRR